MSSIGCAPSKSLKRATGIGIFSATRAAPFPSGHGAHFWGLFFPLAFLFPRYRIPFLIIPLFISVARVGVNDHWCSDVLGFDRDRRCHHASLYLAFPNETGHGQ